MTPPPSPDDRFPSTHWSLVGRLDGPEGRLAMEEFLTRYRGALIAFTRLLARCDTAAAEDLVHDFIADKLLHEQLLTRASAGRGRLRSFLIRALRNYRANQIRAANTKRRSPGQPVQSLAADGPTPHIDDDPAARFHLEWARSLLDQALASMREECEKEDRLTLWELFSARVVQPMLDGTPAPGYAELVERFSFRSPGEASNALVTAKRMFARHMRRQVSEYAIDPAEVDEELAELQAILGTGGARSDQ